jgi:hypothetical protein
MESKDCSEALLATHFHGLCSEALLTSCFNAGFLLGLFFDPEFEGDMLLRNVGRLSTNYTALYPRR